MTKYTPAVRTLLTFLATALGVVIATVHNETVRIIGAALITGLAGIGITPPHLNTVTSVVPPKKRAAGRL